jgi:hypothetical protein
VANLFWGVLVDDGHYHSNKKDSISFPLPPNVWLHVWEFFHKLQPQFLDYIPGTLQHQEAPRNMTCFSGPLLCMAGTSSFIHSFQIWASLSHLTVTIEFSLKFWLRCTVYKMSILPYDESHDTTHRLHKYSTLHLLLYLHHKKSEEAMEILVTTKKS